MTFRDYLTSCADFLRDTAGWAALDPYKHYVAVEHDGWAETCDNHENGIDLSWCFDNNEAPSVAAAAVYREAAMNECEQSKAERWDCEQMRSFFRKYDGIVVNNAGYVFLEDEWPAIEERMDEEIREALLRAVPKIETHQEFFRACASFHLAKFNETWPLDKAVPEW